MNDSIGGWAAALDWESPEAPELGGINTSWVSHIYPVSCKFAKQMFLKL